MYNQKAWQTKGMVQLLGAAAVSKNFFERFISNPKKALQEGFQGQPFDLSNEEYDYLVSINPKSVKEFAQLVIERGNHNGNGAHKNNGYHTNGHYKNGQLNGGHRKSMLKLR